MCRAVRRGQATGCNRVWIAADTAPAVPDALRFPSVTRAQTIFDALGGPLPVSGLRAVIDIPADLDVLDAAEREAVAAFLVWAQAEGAHQSCIAQHRHPWWRVRLMPPAPLPVTYMARRRPAFVHNPNGARHLNIAHGITLRDACPEGSIDGLCAWLDGHVSLAQGRPYAGELVKFEPGDFARMRVPPPDYWDAFSETPNGDRAAPGSIPLTGTP